MRSPAQLIAEHSESNGKVTVSFMEAAKFRIELRRVLALAERMKAIDERIVARKA